ncbi:site-specific DNA-methyltransferase [Helicobacter sp. MIT 05-5293]|uniref:DNA-methyltransferase n=1 Tax=Helicobacter sp. MIT 05-5293 TaxID=1548149 RepID=UPI0010FDF020|nr:DNA methyltransferase [Helicobacter sp. MIT 05-5293]TLD80149.1 site-specific DNA-methyltransferase [Helicobacter sp. MIT 05-5293]
MEYINEKERIAIYHTDCVELAKSLPDEAIDFSVYSPPFANLYTYSDNLADMGNCANDEEFFNQYKYLIKEKFRITRNGRLTAIHCKDLPKYKNRNGASGLVDFAGAIIKAHEECGWTYHSRITIWKDPVIEMQRTKNQGLLYKQVCKDSAYSRQGMADYIIVMRKCVYEDNVPVCNENGAERFYDYIGSSYLAPKIDKSALMRSVNEAQRLYSIEVWQRYASPVWFDIAQTNVLNTALAKDGKDEKHICPLQLDVIERCIELWSNKSEIVFSPFMGIGSEGYQAVLQNRGFVGSELKESYFAIAEANIKKAISEKQSLFDMPF